MNIKNALANLAAERAARWKPYVVKKLPQLETLREPVIFGTYSFSYIERRIRLIKDPIQIVDGICETPSTIARDYLKVTYNTGPRITHKQAITINAIPPVPNYAKPDRFAHGFYIDIVSCYWSIMQIAGWDVDYYPGLWLSPGRPPADFPFPNHKIARNCLVASGRITTIPMYDPRKLPGNPFVEIKSNNKLKNHQLPKLIHDILNVVAYQCIQQGAIYVNNDGLIAPTPNTAANCIQIIKDWGLTPAIKAEGPGLIKAAGTYKIGAKKTANWQIREKARHINNVIKLPYMEWLQKEFEQLAARKKI